MTTTVALERIGKTFKAKYGEKGQIGQECRRCVFKVIDDKSQLYNQHVIMHVFKTFDFCDKDGNLRPEIPHYIIKRNLELGIVFKDVQIIENLPVTENNKIYIDHFHGHITVLKNGKK